MSVGVAPVPEMQACRIQRRGGFRASLLIELRLRSISTTAQTLSVRPLKPGAWPECTPWRLFYEGPACSKATEEARTYTENNRTDRTLDRIDRTLRFNFQTVRFVCIIPSRPSLAGSGLYSFLLLLSAASLRTSVQMHQCDSTARSSCDTETSV